MAGAAARDPMIAAERIGLEMARPLALSLAPSLKG
jgi:hypothetical protein